MNGCVLLHIPAMRRTRFSVAARTSGRLTVPLTLMLILLLTGGKALPASILFIGNSFTYGGNSAVHSYRADTVTDLNGEGIGGVPALFKSFATQTGLTYEVSLETEAGVGLDWHLQHRREVIGRQRWDVVVMHGYSTLDKDKPGDPRLLIASARADGAVAARRRRRRSGAIAVFRRPAAADQVYDPKGAWYGKSVESMPVICVRRTTWRQREFVHLRAWCRWGRPGSEASTAGSRSPTPTMAAMPGRLTCGLKMATTPVYLVTTCRH